MDHGAHQILLVEDPNSVLPEQSVHISHPDVVIGDVMVLSPEVYVVEEGHSCQRLPTVVR